MYCEFVNTIICEYIVKEDVKVEEGKKQTFLKSILKKIKMKSVVVVQDSSLEKFFADMPLQA